jgi:hypothetical protein
MAGKVWVSLVGQLAAEVVKLDDTVATVAEEAALFGRERDALRARVTQLEAALQPFADVERGILPDMPGALERARAVLSGRGSDGRSDG